MVRQRSTSTSQLNILMLYDEGSTFVRTIYEHLVAFDKYSRHPYHFLSATRAATEAGESGGEFDFGCFDAVVIHYSVRVSVPQQLTREVATAVARYRGSKLPFIQDEYEGTETARQWIEALGIDSVYIEGQRYSYAPSSRNAIVISLYRCAGREACQGDDLQRTGTRALRRAGRPVLGPYRPTKRPL